MSLGPFSSESAVQDAACAKRLLPQPRMTAEELCTGLLNMAHDRFAWEELRLAVLREEVEGETP